MPIAPKTEASPHRRRTVTVEPYTRAMPLSRRHLLGAALGGGAALLARPAQAQNDHMVVSRHRVPWPGRRRIRVAQLTDVHVGWGTPEAVLRKAARIARSADPDVTVLTGDYVNSSVEHIAVLRRFVRWLPQPVVAVLGNHDHWTGATEIRRALEAGGAEVLQNAVSGIGGAGWRLDIAGVDDGYSEHDDVEGTLRGVEDAERALVLTHLPTTGKAISNHGARLVLSGHTHGGQVALHFLTAAVHQLVGNAYLQGWFQLQETQLYVNAGIGHSLEGLRGGEAATAELAVFDLDPGARKRETRRHRTSLV